MTAPLRLQYGERGATGRLRAGVRVGVDGNGGSSTDAASNVDASVRTEVPGIGPATLTRPVEARLAGEGSDTAVKTL